MRILVDNIAALVPAWESSLREVLDRAGLGNDLSIAAVDKDFAAVLSQWSGELSFLHYLATELNGWPDDLRFFLPGANSAHAESCKREVPGALYGCCLGGFLIAVEYAPSSHKLSTQLHESLHLFGVGDCYQEDGYGPISACNNPLCVMRYGVDSIEVCDHVISQLQS